MSGFLNKIVENESSFILISNANINLESMLKGLLEVIYILNKIKSIHKLKMTKNRLLLLYLIAK